MDRFGSHGWTQHLTLMSNTSETVAFSIWEKKSDDRIAQWKFHWVMNMEFYLVESETRVLLRAASSLLSALNEGWGVYHSVYEHEPRFMITNSRIWYQRAFLQRFMWSTVELMKIESCMYVAEKPRLALKCELRSTISSLSQCLWT